ncbi:hypothetical protein [Pseudomonas sp. SLFW]|uniref:hypothetical protein n=1 Tax=Pseudomonas sp. SLFW TaxID=2683259 RepID=UPI001412DBD7|nr:hypothetical protein [Pseudomonas sp. SLFW]
MNAKKRKAKMQLMIELKGEARMLADVFSENQKRFLRVGLALGKDLEPPGPLAGPRG